MYNLPSNRNSRRMFTPRGSRYMCRTCVKLLVTRNDENLAHASLLNNLGILLLYVTVR